MPCPRFALLVSLALLPGLSTAQTEWVDVPLSAETWWEQGNAEFRQGEYAIDVPAGSALEYKLGLQEGAMITYSWTVAMDDPSLLGVEFHGHTEPVPDEPGTVMFYKVHQEGRESGALRAPFSGIHGWYLDNQSEQDVVVRLKVAGFYQELAAP
ncbi:MAG TPA: hypothetical protein VNR18_05105 [Hyphomicrobiales bacterium]|nr:hypothetical protein [Hyphomicrobiales bacterium]